SQKVEDTSKWRVTTMNLIARHANNIRNITELSVVPKSTFIFLLFTCTLEEVTLSRVGEKLDTILALLCSRCDALHSLTITEEFQLRVQPDFPPTCKFLICRMLERAHLLVHLDLSHCHCPTAEPEGRLSESIIEALSRAPCAATLRSLIMVKTDVFQPSGH